MKKMNQFKLTSAGILTTCLLVLAVSCGKKQDQDPTPAAPTKTITSGPTQYSTMCGTASDSVCNLPYRLFSAFLPSGYWKNTEVTTTLTIDSCGETPAYAGEGLRIVYTNHGGYWGASFLNNNNWGATYKVNPAATKITFNMRIDYSANVTFLVFGDAKYGKKEFYPTTPSVANPVWENVTIPILSIPTTFATPLSIEIDGAIGGTTQNGKAVVVDIKDLLIE